MAADNKAINDSNMQLGQSLISEQEIVYLTGYLWEDFEGVGDGRIKVAGVRDYP